MSFLYNLHHPLRSYYLILIVRPSRPNHQHPSTQPMLAQG